MDYSQSIKFKKEVFTKQEIVKFHDDFYNIIKILAIEPMQLILKISIANEKNYNFYNIDEFKNKIQWNDEITNVLLSVCCGIKETSSVSLMTVFKETIIVFTSKNKFWVDEEVFKYKDKFKISKNDKKKFKISKNDIIENPNKIRETNLNTHEQYKSKTLRQRTKVKATIGIFITFFIVILGWMILK